MRRPVFIGVQARSTMHCVCACLQGRLPNAKRSLDVVRVTGMTHKRYGEGRLLYVKRVRHGRGDDEAARRHGPADAASLNMSRRGVIRRRKSCGSCSP